jgi:hypothetical protein
VVQIAHQHRNPEVERLFRERAVGRGLNIVKVPILTHPAPAFPQAWCRRSPSSQNGTCQEVDVQDRERYGDVRFTIILLKQSE